MSVNMIKGNNKTRNFDVKAKLMQLDLQSQADALNLLYENKLKFNVHTNFEDEQKIRISIIDKSIDILELPEVSELDFKNLFDDFFGNKISVIKFPKCMPMIDIKDMFWLYKVERIFAWDDNLKNLDYIRERGDRLSSLSMLIMQYSSGKKPVIYRF